MKTLLFLSLALLVITLMLLAAAIVLIREKNAKLRQRFTPEQMMAAWRYILADRSHPLHGVYFKYKDYDEFLQGEIPSFLQNARFQGDRLDSFADACRQANKIRNLDQC